jgi:uncharacterized protein YegL
MNKMKTKSFSNHAKLILTALLINAAIYSGYSQLGYSSASLSYGKMQTTYVPQYTYVTSPDNCNQKIYVPIPQLPEPSEVVVEEYINYHKHMLEAPKEGASVGIDLRWDRVSNSSDDIIVQAGFSTEDIKNLQKIPPINVCLVIDHSGSMEGDKIEKAKLAAVEFVKNLRSEDILSIVIFDHIVDVIYPAQRFGNGVQAINSLRCISARGSTDLNSGLITGYKEVMKNFSNKFNNKVIMLTDALTNTGEIDPEKIIRNSCNVTENMVDITVIGVGVDFNNDLSRKLTGSGHTSIFFINDNEDIRKLFKDEIQSMMGQIAKDVDLEISYSGDISLAKLYGYNPKFTSNGFKIHLNNMNNGLTQVVLMKFNPNKCKNESNLIVNVKLSYFDIAKNEKVTQNKKLLINNLGGDGKCSVAFCDNDIKKNFSIAEMSQALYDMACEAHCGNYYKCWLTLDLALNNTKSRYFCMNDPDIKRVYDILYAYENSLVNFKRGYCCDRD